MRRTKIRVIGIGGGAGNIVGEIARLVGKADFVSANTDVQAQKSLPKSVRVFAFGQEQTGGLGCGMDSQLAEEAAKAEKERIKKLVEGQDVCLLVACLGGGTGSGASSVFAEAAREAKCLTLGIFTLPFSFEGQKRQELAQAGLEKTVPLLNAYSVIPNENIFRVIDQKTPLRASFSAVNRKLAETLEGFLETLSLPGLINIDFADVRTLLEGRGRLAYLNSSHMQGAAGPQLALKEVLNNPLYDYGIEGADRMVFNLTGDKGMKMQDVADISKSISSFNTKARIIFGISFVPQFKDKLRVALFAIGCRQGERPREEKARKTGGAKKKEQAASQASSRKLAKKQTPARSQGEAKEEALHRKKQPSLQKEPPKEQSRVRRNALDLKKARELELKDLEKQERQWDIPSFLRNARGEEAA